LLASGIESREVVLLLDEGEWRQLVFEGRALGKWVRGIDCHAGSLGATGFRRNRGDRGD
ncbi:MAG: hypothetical protein RL414_894, partial [Actinomycetota bacterium]